VQDVHLTSHLALFLIKLSSNVTAFSGCFTPENWV